MLANPRKKWDKLGDLLEKEVRENLSKPRESQRPISQILRDFAKKYDTTVSSASFYYYEEIKDRIFNSDNKYVEDDITINSRKIKNYLEEKIDGKVSDIAFEEIKKMVEVYGSISTLLNIIEVVDNLEELDMSYIIVSEVKKRLIK